MKFLHCLLPCVLILTASVASADVAGASVPTQAAVKSPAAKTRLPRAEKQMDQRRLDELRQIETGGKNRAQLPNRNTGDAAAGTAFEGRGTIGRGETKDVNELVRDLMGLGGNGLDSAKIGRSDEGGFNAARYGNGSAADAAGAPADPGHSSSKGQFGRTSYSDHQEGRSRAYTAEFDHSSGRSSQVAESWTPNEYGGVTHVVTHTVSSWQGSVQYTAESVEATDSKGNVVESYANESGSPLDDEDQADLNNAAAEIVAQLRDKTSQGAPDDNQTGKSGPCNPVSGFGCEKRKSSHMHKIAQPAHGDDVKTMAGTGGRPNAGPSSVTNPGNHNGTAGNGGGSNRGKPGSSAVDPEEIIPPVGGKSSH